MHQVGQVMEKFKLQNEAMERFRRQNEAIVEIFRPKALQEIEKKFTIFSKASEIFGLHKEISKKINLLSVQPRFIQQERQEIIKEPENNHANLSKSRDY